MPDAEQTTREAVLSHPSSAREDASTPQNSAPHTSEAGWNGDSPTVLSASDDSQVNDSSMALPEDLSAVADQSAPGFRSDVDGLATPGAAASVMPHDLTRSLARLELNSIQVRHYLDAIEEKISRMEPRLEQMRDLQQPASTAEDPAPGLPADPTTTPIAFPTESTTERRRRRFEIASDPFSDRLVPPRSETRSPLEEQPWALKPWLAARRKQLAVAGVVFLAFVTILTFGAGNHGRSPATTPGIAAKIPTPAPAAAKSSAGTVAFSLSTSPAPSGTSSAPAAPSSFSTNTSAPIFNARPDPPASASAPENSPSASPNSASSSLRESRTIEANARATAPAIGIPSGRVRVSSGVMAGNLLYSPTPKYPRGFASLFHTQGQVTLQAIIARNGRVEDLRVLSGHHLLRGAAEDAVRTWRYRPYVISGVPVEVATIITVEFHR